MGFLQTLSGLFEDYRSFISRPTIVAQEIKEQVNKRIFIIESDLKQFYDRVRPEILGHALQRLKKNNDEKPFFDFACWVLDWPWDNRDIKGIAAYAKQAELDDFTRVALPQGLVSAGFFANVVLLAFDAVLKNNIGSEIEEGIRLEDACRYVDDLRIVVTTDRGADECQNAVCKWLQNLLDKDKSRLRVAEDKTKVAEFGGHEYPLVRQSLKMERIQSMVSGGFDALGGIETLDAIQGLLRSQEALSNETTGHDWRFTPIPDVRDETVARFSAARFRITYRSLRPLLEEGYLGDTGEEVTGDLDDSGSIKSARSRKDLDEDARAFALGLIERWVNDPSNVRLLRIGLDIYPDVNVLKAILELLRPFTEKGGRRKAPRRIAWYCLAELLRAGATETGFVEDDELLPSDINIQQYRETLGKEATKLITLPTGTIPWYLRQQALLFLAVFDPVNAPVTHAGRNPEMRLYRQLIIFLKGNTFQGTAQDKPTDAEFATLAVLGRRSFATADRAAQLTSPGLTTAQKKEIVDRDLTFARELSRDNIEFINDLPPDIRVGLCFEHGPGRKDKDGDAEESLAKIVLSSETEDKLRNELTLLRFAVTLLEEFQKLQFEAKAILPSHIYLTFCADRQVADLKKLEISPGLESFHFSSLANTPYDVPFWCAPDKRWRLQLGFLLRFILTRQPDFTTIIRPEYWKETSGAYRPAKSHWYQRLYGLFNGQPAFGDDWLPISDWMEMLLLALLRWPGVKTPRGFKWVDSSLKNVLKKLKKRILKLESKRGRSTGTLMIPLDVNQPYKNGSTRALRACVIQTVIPNAEHFDKTNDLTLSTPNIRRMHRNHLSAALAAVKRMLDLRKTHMDDEGRLDWLILPELAVHPLDVRTHLLPFARAYKTLILAGLTYEELFKNKPLVNSALWVIPEWSSAHGLQTRIRRQGKYHLAPDEQIINNNGSARLQRFRPCQWLVSYPWSEGCEPVWLTASVCYDATDLRLVADLRDKSDIFAIPALNRDIKTFDQMAQALHYHMFQLVLVANNGRYGGSNAYWPIDDVHRRQLFHLHGQPQASIAFFEIDDIESYLKRQDNIAKKEIQGPSTNFKHPPAGFNEAQ